jgi:toxin FitB
MITLDTNLLSALMRAQPDQVVLRWLDRQPDSSVWTTSITLMEIWYGLQSIAAGRRRDRMTEELAAVWREEIEERYAVFDIAAAEHAADLMASRRLKGRAGEYRDTMIAGIALATGATLKMQDGTYVWKAAVESFELAKSKVGVGDERAG